MNHPDTLPLPIVEAVEKVFDLYNDYIPTPAKFSLTTTTSLLTVAVFKALLHHAIAPSSVANNFWQFLKPHFDDVLEEHGDPTDLQSLGPRHGGWTRIENKLLQMTERALDDLTNEMNQHAYEWMARLLLPIRSRGKTPVSLKTANTLHKRVGKFREQVLEREGHVCPVTLLRNDDEFAGEEDEKSGPLVLLEAAHIIPFAIANADDLFWKYVEMFTGDNRYQDILKDINVVENGILLQHDIHAAFGNLAWGIETTTENGNYRYFIKTFRRRIYFQRPGVGTGTELHFSRDSGHSPPDPDICALHLAVCAVASACGAAGVFNKLFEHDPDIIGPISGEYTLPEGPDSDRFVLPYLERRLLEESIRVPLQIF